MHWEVIIPGTADGGLTKSVTVEAKNWFSALRSGLDKQGMDGKLLANLTCNINPDQSVTVSDFVTRRTYTLRPVNSERSPESERRPSQTPTPKSDDNLVDHEVFFERDELSEDEKGVFFRERLIAVAQTVSRGEASQLAQSYFERLKDTDSAKGKLFISIQVFDHVFEQHSKWPAITTLTWKAWMEQTPEINFPLAGEGRVTYSTLPLSGPDDGAQALAADKKNDSEEDPPIALVRESRPSLEVLPTPMPGPLVPEPPSTSASVAPEPKKKQARESSPPKGSRKKEKSKSRKEIKSKEKSTKRRKKLITPPPTSIGNDPQIEDKMVFAFERMQDIYGMRTHDDAAVFALTLATELIDCQAGSCMLISPGKYELYVAAAMGPKASNVIGRKLSLNKGIVGFATRMGVVINVSDPANDPRFHGEIDEQTGFETKNVACAPVQFEGRTIGAIEMLNSPCRDGFMQNDLNILSYVAGSLAEYIDTYLPSREADFTDRDFSEFLPAKKVSSPPSRAGIKKKSRTSTPAERVASMVARVGLKPSKKKKKKKKK